MEEKAEFAWAQFPWSENIKQKETKAVVAAIQCRLHCFRMQLCSISFILGLMMLLNDLPCLSWEKFNASWALFIGGGYCIDSENCVIAKLESQFIGP